jgi:outer membrane biosynthesis protein TonB
MKPLHCALLALTLALGACSRKAAEPDPAQAAAAPPPPQKTVIDTQLKALQRAKDVQKTVDQQKAELEKQMKEQGGG